MTSGCKGHVIFLDTYSNNHKAKLQLILFFYMTVCPHDEIMMEMLIPLYFITMKNKF